MDSPAASAEVHPAGRNALPRRSNTAPEPARHVPSAFGYAANSSYDRQFAWSYRRMCRSPVLFGPPSITGVGRDRIGHLVAFRPVLEAHLHARLAGRDRRDRDTDRPTIPEPGAEVRVYGLGRPDARDVRRRLCVDREPGHRRVPDVVGREDRALPRSTERATRRTHRHARWRGHTRGVAGRRRVRADVGSGRWRTGAARQHRTEHRDADRSHESSLSHRRILANCAVYCT